MRYLISLVALILLFTLSMRLGNSQQIIRLPESSIERNRQIQYFREVQVGELFLPVCELETEESKHECYMISESQCRQAARSARDVCSANEDDFEKRSDVYYYDTTQSNGAMYQIFECFSVTLHNEIIDAGGQVTEACYQ